MNYMIAWRRLSFRGEKGKLRLRYYKRVYEGALKQTRELGDAWTTKDKDLANRTCRELLESGYTGTPFAHVIAVPDRELFEARLKGE